MTGTPRGPGGLDEFYEDRVLPQLTNLNPQLRAEAELGLVKQLGTIPNRLAQTTRTHLTHGTPEAATFAANALMKLARDVPKAITPIPQKDLARAALLTTYTQTGLDPATAAERAKEAITLDPTTTTDRDTDFAATLEDNLFDDGLFTNFGDNAFNPDDLIFPNPGFGSKLPELPGDWNTSPVERDKPEAQDEGEVNEQLATISNGGLEDGDFSKEDDKDKSVQVAGWFSKTVEIVDDNDLQSSTSLSNSDCGCNKNNVFKYGGDVFEVGGEQMALDCNRGIKTGEDSDSKGKLYWVRHSTLSYWDAQSKNDKIPPYDERC
jgi:hypothetical protein